MNQRTYLTLTAPLLRNLASRATIGDGLIRVVIALACIALVPAGWAVTPAPDGGYPGKNTAEGEDALFSLTTGTENTAVGYQALYTNSTGSGNSAHGASALFSNTTGSDNAASGAFALYSNTIGDDNAATGYQALYSNTTGGFNTANGSAALYANTDGLENTATGFEALFSNTSGFGNTATGFSALYLNTTGGSNTATGEGALLSNSTGGVNTANGAHALQNNSTGNFNTALGADALVDNTTGSSNTALGFLAGRFLTTGSNNIDIANAGVAGESNTIRIGTPGSQTRAFFAGISGVPVSGGTPVRVNSAGQLGTAPSAARFKENIQQMDKASEAIHALKPVTFHYKKELDPEAVPQFGLIAEDVAKVNPDLVVRDDKGEIYTVRYDAVNAMLLNEFLKQHREMQELKAALAKQQEQIEALSGHLD